MTGLYKQNRQIFLGRTGLAVILLLTALCVWGSFMGDEKAGIFFNSPLMIAVWVVLLLSLTASAVFFPRIKNNAGLFCIHIGCAMILLGGMIQTDAGHSILNAVTGGNKIIEAVMIIDEGSDCNEAYSTAGNPVKLPFKVALSDFRIEYAAGRIQQYVSDIKITGTNGDSYSKSVSVNHPAFYRGYHLYQYGYDQNEGRYTVLKIASAEGLGTGYAGFVMLLSGLFIQCWYKGLRRKI